MDEGLDPILDLIAAWLNNLDIQIVRILASVFWYLEKVSAAVTDFLTQENLWDTLLGTLLDALRNVFPDILNSLLFGDGGGPGGLLYLALMLAGLFLILPHLGGTKLVDAGRVVVWAVVIITLFVGSMAGYDLVGVMEGLRQESTQIVIEAVSDTGSLSDLVAQPMQATPAELTDWTFTLPSAFANIYYPEPDPDTDFEVREVVILDNWVTGRWAYELTIETQASQDLRQTQSREGILLSVLTLAPAYVLILFGLTFATLAAAALVLIIFFLTALPLGFFEFGAPILMGIAKQYAYLFALTLAATILPGILVGAGTLIFAGIPTISDMIAYLPILIIVAIAAQYMAQMAWSAMTGTFGIVTSSVKASVGSYAYAAKVPEAGGVPGLNETVVGLAALAGAAATGGTAAVAVGALGLSQNKGDAPGNNPNASAAAHAFTQTNSSSRPGTSNGRSANRTSSVFKQQNSPIWSAPQAPQLLAESVSQAPGAMGEDKAAAYALRDLSREMNLSDDSIAKIFEAVHDAEKEADAADDAEDNLKSTSDKLTAKGVGRGQAAYDVHELARLATLVATTARLNSPKATAARILQAPETIKGNQPAALAMNQLAHSIKLDQDSVASVFQAVRRGQQAGLSGQAQVKYVASEVSGIPRKPEDVQELARLAVLVEVGSANTTSPSKKEKVKK